MTARSKAAVPAQVKKAEEAIRHFESFGRAVVGVSIMKDGYKIEFASEAGPVNPIDLVNMGD